VGSHFGKLKFGWTLEFSKGDFKGQKSLDQRIFYTMGNLLRHRCLKWVARPIWVIKT